MYEDDDTDMALAHFTTGVTCVTAGYAPLYGAASVAGHRRSAL